MKEYTSPAVTGQKLRDSYILEALTKALSTSSIALEGSTLPNAVISKLLGDDFTSLRIDSLSPCLEA